MDEAHLALGIVAVARHFEAEPGDTIGGARHGGEIVVDRGPRRLAAEEGAAHDGDRFGIDAAAEDGLREEALRLAIVGEVLEQRLDGAGGARLGLDELEQRRLRAPVGELARDAGAVVAGDEIGGGLGAAEARGPDHDPLGEGRRALSLQLPSAAEALESGAASRFGWSWSRAERPWSSRRSTASAGAAGAAAKARRRG